METLVLLHQFYLAQAFVTVIATLSGALLRSVIKLGRLGRLEGDYSFTIYLGYLIWDLLFCYFLCTTPFEISMRSNSRDLILAGFQNPIEIWDLNWDAILIWFEFLAQRFIYFSWWISLVCNRWILFQNRFLSSTTFQWLLLLMIHLLSISGCSLDYHSYSYDKHICIQMTLFSFF